MAKSFKMAIMGAGKIAGQMAAAINGLVEYGIEAYAVASRSLEKAQEFATKWNFAKAYGSYEEMVTDPAIQLVYIATPHAMHYENALLCIEHGKNILVEKAFTANADQAKEVMALAEKKGVFVAEAIWTRYMPAVQILRDMLASGTIGQVDSVEADFSVPISRVQRLQDPALAGGALLDLGVYTLTFASMFLGDDIASVKSRCLRYETGVDATDHIELLYRDGRQAFLRTSMVSGSRNEGKINGTKGYIEVSNLNNLEKLQVFDADGQPVETIVPPQIVNGYEYEVLACQKAIEAGQLECEQMPHAETILLMEQMDHLRKSWGVVYPFEKRREYDWARENDESLLEVYDIETGERRVLAEFDYVIEAPNWSVDGKYLTYNSKGRIYKYDLESGNIEEVPSGHVINCNNDHVLAPDGSGIAVSHNVEEDGQSRIYVIAFAGEGGDAAEPRLVTPLAPSYLHGWSPDGSTLAYCAERNGEYDIYTIPVTGGMEKRLTFASGLNDGPEYDSAGEYIWFNSVRTGRMQAWRMKADGSEQTQMTFDEEWNTWFPHVSPDRKKVVMLAYHRDDVEAGDHVPNKNVEIRLMSADGGEAKTIIKLFGGQGTINVNSWAPDSKRFAFVSYRKREK